MKRTSLLLSLFSFLLLAFVIGNLLQSVHAHAATGGHVLQREFNFQVNPNSGNMTYHGGPVMHGTAHLYAIFWEPTGSYVSPMYNSLILRYFSDVGSSPLYHNNSQYHNSHGTSPHNAVLAGSWVDTAAYPSNPVQDSDIQNEVTHAQQVNGWASSIQAIFFVFTAKNEVTCGPYGCSFSGNCAYHDFFGSHPATIYADMPYAGSDQSGCGAPTSPNHDVDADREITLIDHEQMEAATDPLYTAWYSSYYNGGEIGDKCYGVYGNINKNGANVIWNGHPYIVQEEWDNAKSGCVLKGS
ncbi:MAG: hypothetical protein ABI406_02710 [Ktedonobacteraceae bacterium]